MSKALEEREKEWAEHDAHIAASERERILSRIPEWFQQLHNGRAECVFCRAYRDEGHKPNCERERRSGTP